MKSFRHVNATTIKEAVSLLRTNGEKARLIAGGTDLLGVLKDNILADQPEVVINIKTIPDLDYIKGNTAGVRIGPLAKLADIIQSPFIKSEYNLLAKAAESVASPQIRTMGTLGGNICQDVRCWYYRYPHHMGGRFQCFLKGGKSCYALRGENRYHSIFGGWREESTPCSSACPAGVDIPLYMSHIREGDLPQVARILLETNPLPAITGRVCPHFCEQECNRGDFDESVSIRDIERFMGDYILENADEIIQAPGADTGKKVAIAGSGPAGLSAAYYLRMSGHQVTVFDKREEAGGMLAYVIPAYRLPKDIVRRVVKAIKNTGVEFRLKVDVGKDITLDDLRRDFDSVFIASGAWNPVSIGLEGEELARFCLDFLTNINLGVKEVPGKKVAVIGGGNAAIDVAVSALRLGAEEATMVCLESPEEMPALPWEIEQAVEQGVKVMNCWGPNRALTAEGKVKGLELIRCTSVFDEQGCFAPTYDSAVTDTVEADQILMAVGYATDFSFLDLGSSLKVEGGLIVVDPDTQATSLPGVFAGGSATHGPATVIEAIASGEKAAAAVDVYLRGASDEAEEKAEKAAKPFLRFNSDYLKETRRVEMPKRPVAERSIALEDALGLGLNDIEEEANRCFNCGCLAINSSDIAVALLALNAKIKIEGQGGVRTVPADDFFGSFRNALANHELLTEIQIPRPCAKNKQTFIKFRLRDAVDFSIVSVATCIGFDGDICTDASIALGGVAPIPIRAVESERIIKGKEINAATAKLASEAAIHGTVALGRNEYKIEIVKTLVNKAILE